MMLYLYILILILILLLIYYFKKSQNMKEQLEKLKHKKTSNEIKHGQIFEQLIPFSQNFPFDPKNFKFLGNPIDGIVFENDKIIFVEIKLNNSTLSAKQKKIKDLIEKKEVYWYTFQGV